MSQGMRPTPTAARRFAVIGSGASGCYAVEALLRQDPETRIDVIERLPTPFGLIRYGVAPDHQGTKAVARTLERFLGNPRVRYFGNVAVGREIRLDEIASVYDAVILATGVNRDRKLGLPGEDLRGVLGSGAFAGWYNDHPDAVEVKPILARTRRAVVIGAGNVALDVARQLAKRPHDQAGTDISSMVEQALSNAPIESVMLAGRCVPQGARFSLHEFRELNRVAAGRIGLDPRARSMSSKPTESVPALQQELLALPCSNIDASHDALERRQVKLHFGFEPLEFIPSASDPSCVTAVRWRVRTTDAHREEHRSEELVLPADLVVTCIGYDFQNRFGLGAAGGVLHHSDGKIRDKLYVVGWAKRGPSGTIATNRADSHAVVEKVCKEVLHPAGCSVLPGIEPMLRERGLNWIDYAGWKEIDRLEMSAAAPGRVRSKLTSRENQLAVGGRARRDAAITQ